MLSHDTNTIYGINNCLCFGVENITIYNRYIFQNNLLKVVPLKIKPSVTFFLSDAFCATLYL